MAMQGNIGHKSVRLYFRNGSELNLFSRTPAGRTGGDPKHCRGIWWPPLGTKLKRNPLLIPRPFTAR